MARALPAISMDLQFCQCHKIMLYRCADLVEPHGYPLSEHFVTTSDGFVLRLFRIRHGRQQQPVAQSAAPPAAPQFEARCPAAPAAGAGDRSHTEEESSAPSYAAPAAAACPATVANARTVIGAAVPQPLAAGAAAPRPMVFLQHALLDSSAGWVLLGPEASLPFLLADAGFDVWLGNVRGNRFSRNHTSLGASDPAFWSWSWQHMAAHDLPDSTAMALAVSGALCCAWCGAVASGGSAACYSVAQYMQYEKNWAVVVYRWRQARGLYAGYRQGSTRGLATVHA